MKVGIHPQYHQATVKCACGNTFVVGSTKPQIDVEICAKCHPFFTGEMRFVDTMGRVEKFRQKMVSGSTYSKKKKDDTAVKQVKTLKEMLEERGAELAKLENDTDADQTRIDELRTEIEELELIEQTIRSPDKITENYNDETVCRYYKYYKSRKPPKNYLLVIIKYLNGDGYVVTALFDKHI